MSKGFADLIKLSEYDFLSCKAMEKHFPDEFAVRAALYHLQQAIERLLKCIILIYGETPEFTHNISKLRVCSERLGIKLPEELEDISDTITAWGSTTRYDSFIDFSEKKYSKAKKIYTELSELLRQEIAAVQSIEVDEAEEL